MSEFSDIVAAMALVKDVDIDPTTGQTVLKSNKSILEKSGLQVTGQLKEKVEISKEQQEKIIQEHCAVNQAYIQMCNKNVVPQQPQVKQPIKQIKETVNIDPQPLQSDNRKFNKDYMRDLVKQINRSAGIYD